MNYENRVLYNSGFTLSRKIGEAEDEGEVDFMIYVDQAKFGLR